MLPWGPQVLHGPTPAHPSPSFRNAWVHRLVIKLPTLAVALDDALLAFADYAKGVLGAGGGEGGRANEAELPRVDSQEGKCEGLVAGCGGAGSCVVL